MNAMPEEDRSAYEVALHEACRGDAGAVRYCLDLLEIFHAWDDGVDENDPAALRRAAQLAVVRLPMNPFFQRHAAFLTPLHQSVIMQWKTANAFEDGGTADDLTKAYMLRAGVFQVFHAVAWIVGGDEWADAVGPGLWRVYGETLDEYMAEMRDA